MMFKSKTALINIDPTATLDREKATLSLNEKSKFVMMRGSKLVMGDHSNILIDIGSELRVGENASVFVTSGAKVHIGQTTTIEIEAGTCMSFCGSITIRSNQLEEKKEEVKETKESNASDFNTVLKDLPDELKMSILKMAGFPKVSDPVYEKNVLPRIATEAFIRKLNEIKRNTHFGQRFEFAHTQDYPGNFDVYYNGARYMNVHVDHYKLKKGEGNFIRHYDYEWCTLEHFMDSIIGEKCLGVSIEHRQRYDIFPTSERPYQHEEIGLPFFYNPLLV